MPDEFQPIIDQLSRARRVLVTTHVRPDGDALGTAAAVVLALQSKGIDAEVLLLSHLPRKYAFIFHDNNVVHHDVETEWPDAAGFFSRFDALLVVDTGTWSQLPGLQERIAGWKAPKIVIDHHLTQQEWATIKLVDTKAAAAGEIVAELLNRWHVELTPAIAQALFLAIASDTGWFQFSNTTPRTMRLAATLMEAGVNTDLLYQHLYQNERAERVALQTRALQSLELHSGNRLAVMKLRRSDFAETGANVPDTENIINFPLQIQTVEVSVLLVEPPGPPQAGEIRVSLRSKGHLDVARFAEQFGGGGHARASGLRLAAGLDDAQTRVLSKLNESFAPAV